MGEIIYWKKFRRPKMVHDPILNAERELTGTWICKDDRVKWFGIVGYLKSTGNEMGIKGELLLKDGSRQSFIPKEIHNKVDDDLVKMAEEYLKTSKLYNESVFEKLLPLLNDYTLCKLKQQQIKMKGIVVPKELIELELKLSDLLVQTMCEINPDFFKITK